MLLTFLELAGEALEAGAEAVKLAFQEAAPALPGEELSLAEAGLPPLEDFQPRLAELLEAGEAVPLKPELAEIKKAVRVPRLNSVSSLFSGVEGARASILKNASEDLQAGASAALDPEEALFREEMSEILAEKAKSAEAHQKLWDALRYPERGIQRVEAAQRRRL